MDWYKKSLSMQDSLKICAVIVIVFSISVSATVEVLATNRCRLGTVYRPTSCTRCICGLFNLMLCSQSCFPSDGETPAQPSGSRPTGPTVVPILIPGLIRLPFGSSSRSNLNSTSELELESDKSN